MGEGKVFLIDDDPISLKLFSQSLEKAGFEVNTTQRVIGTVGEINQFAPDIILVDVMLPALSGDKIVKILRESINSQPVIILISNKSEDELKRLTQECGADDYIPKINGPSFMLEKVKKYLIQKKGTC